MSGTTMIRAGLLSTLLAVAACSSDDPPPATDPWADAIELDAVQPDVVIPGSTLVVLGRGFLSSDYAETSLHLTGDFGGHAVDVSATLTFVDDTRLEAILDDALLGALGAGDRRLGAFRGGARLEVTRKFDDMRFSSNAVSVAFDLYPDLTPTLGAMESGTAIWVNQRLPITGSGFLLGGAEGETRARIWGCFTRIGASGCAGVEPVEVLVRPSPDAPFDRTRGTFAFEPQVAGIEPGDFRGTIAIYNVLGEAAGGARIDAGERAVTFRIKAPAITSFGTVGASLGQYVDVQGGGFAGGTDDALTLLEVDAAFTSAASGSDRAVNVLLVPEFKDGLLVRYVLSEEDSLGATINLRREHGTLRGHITPIVQFRGVEVRGAQLPFTFDIQPLRQIVFLNFQSSYVESLRHFGLRAMDRQLRDRILEVVREAYAGVNVEFRDAPPTDFALFSNVDVVGPDPNGSGLFGYDNTPGKDVNNMRLFDRIGGVNATTQDDGFAGYGGVFVESLFGFSTHPGAFAAALMDASPAFDAIFDPQRPDLGGHPVTAEDLEGTGIPPLSSGHQCPVMDGNRRRQIACAIWVLGNLVGTTLAHEVGHSLGLANPDGDNFHDPGDEDNRLMDGGGARPFNERALLYGEGPAVFCDDEYDYLRELMPAAEPPTQPERPGCY